MNDVAVKQEIEARKRGDLQNHGSNDSVFIEILQASHFYYTITVDARARTIGSNVIIFFHRSVC